MHALKFLNFILPKTLDPVRWKVKNSKIKMIEYKQGTQKCFKEATHVMSKIEK